MGEPSSLGDGPVEARYLRQMQAIVAALDDVLNPGLTGDDRTTGFVLLVFPFGEKTGRCNYASNGASREDVATLLEEQAKRFRNPYYSN